MFQNIVVFCRIGVWVRGHGGENVHASKIVFDKFVKIVWTLSDCDECVIVCRLHHTPPPIVRREASEAELMVGNLGR